MKTLDVIAAVTLVLGGFAWGLIGLWGTELLSASWGALGRAFFVLVGLSAIYQALTWRAIQKRWALAWARY